MKEKKFTSKIKQLLFLLTFMLSLGSFQAHAQVIPNHTTTATPTATCFNSDDGRITIEWIFDGSGNVAPYNFTLSQNGAVVYNSGNLEGEEFTTINPGGPWTYTFENLAAGTYVVDGYVTDAYQMAHIEDVIVEELDAFAFTDIEVEDICFGDEEGNSGSIYVEWNNKAQIISWSKVEEQEGGSFSGQSITQGDYTIENLTEGTWEIAVQDFCGVTITETVVIEQLPEFEVTVEASDICFGETTGSIYVEWNNEATFWNIVHQMV